MFILISKKCNPFELVSTLTSLLSVLSGQNLQVLNMHLSSRGSRLVRLGLELPAFDVDGRPERYTDAFSGLSENFSRSR